MTRSAESNAQPFSRPLLVAEVPPEGLETSIRADSKECAALATMNGLVAVTRLEASFRIEREGAERYKVTGEVRADVRQTCVVTLEEFDAKIREPVELRCAPPIEAPASARRSKRPGLARRKGDDEGEIHHIGGLDEEAPDPLIGGVIDLGAIAAEFLTLGLDPYPRKPGASFTEPAPANDGGMDTPFAGLRGAVKKGGRSGNL
jgi:hypothetical protein